jgi:hypothetical protein
MLALKSSEARSERRIVLAPAIAESSIAIPGVEHVLDASLGIEIFFSPVKPSPFLPLKAEPLHLPPRPGLRCSSLHRPTPPRPSPLNLLLPPPIPPQIAVLLRLPGLGLQSASPPP